MNILEKKKSIEAKRVLRKYNYFSGLKRGRRIFRILDNY